MNGHVPPHAETATGEAAALKDLARSVAERQLAWLDALAQMGVEIARAAGDRAVSAPDATGLGVAAMAYTRASRAVRMSILLQSRVLAELQVFEAGFPARAAAAGDDADALRTGVDPAALHEATVESPEQGEAESGEGPESLERLVGEAGERLDDEAVCREVLTRPISEVVALICRDLGLSPDRARLAQDAWDKAEIEGGDPASPFGKVPRPPPFDGEGKLDRPVRGVPPPLVFERQPAGP